jgi:hypothetical protein
MSNALYSVILDYRGGTYVAQIRADSIVDAMRDWVEGLSDHNLKLWHVARESLRLLTRQEAVPLRGCLGVWCLAGTVDRDLALINIVATRDDLEAHLPIES